jgi:hypothetical protein
MFRLGTKDQYRFQNSPSFGTVVSQVNADYTLTTYLSTDIFIVA